MRLEFTEKHQSFRQEARKWLTSNIPTHPLPSGDSQDGFALHVEWEKKLFKAGWAAVSWPKVYGGREVSLVEWLIFEEEYYRAGAPNRVTQNGIFLMAPTLFKYGTETQKSRFIKNIAAATDLWAQAWSEPGAGSDLAAIRSTAKQSHDKKGWRLNGQKTWCTRGAFCSWIFGLFRTDPESQRHKGLTYFVIPTKSEGVTIRGFSRLDGDEGFAEVFFDEVFVPHENVIGEVHQGWSVAMATTSSERGLTLRSPGRFMATANKLIALYQTQKAKIGPQLEKRIVKAWMDAQAYRLYTYRTVAAMDRGEDLGARASLNKIFWSELDIEFHQIALELLGAEAEVVDHSPTSTAGGEWMKGFQFSLAGPIYAGTNEIQRDIVSERILKLPRGR